MSVAFTAGASGGSAITSYKYSTDGGTTFITRAAGSTASPLVISTLSSDGTTALVNGTSYNIQLKAVNAIGDGTATSSTAATPRILATAILMTTQPVGGTSGAALATQPVVRIVDSTNNTVTTSTASVTVTASGGTLGGTTTVTAVNGVATFTDLTNTTAGSYTLTFTSTSPTTLTSATSASFTSAGAANNGHVVFSYMDSMIYQQVVVSDMANTASQTISFKARNAAYGPDQLSVFVNLYNSGGDVLAAPVECPHAALTDSYQTFSCAITPASVTLQGGVTWSQIGRITVEVNGRDSESWGGNYGTVVDYVSIVATKANGTSSEQLLNHDFNTVVNFAPSNWTISGESWAACSGLSTSTLCVGFDDRPYHENYTTSM